MSLQVWVLLLKFLDHHLSLGLISLSFLLFEPLSILRPGRNNMNLLITALSLV